MKEYSINCICNGGKPFFIGTYDNFRDCYNSLEIMVNLEKERGRPYFVDLEYFPNDYKCYISGKYFKIVERDVSQWKKYIKNTTDNIRNNIIKIY